VIKLKAVTGSSSTGSRPAADIASIVNPNVKNSILMSPVKITEFSEL